MKYSFLSVVTIASIICFSGAASGEQVVFEMRGTARIFDENEPRILPDINTGDECSVRLAYDLSTPPTGTGLAVDYTHLPPLGTNGITLKVGSLQIETNPSNPFTVYIYDSDSIDSFGLGARDPIWPGLGDVESSFFKLETAADGSAFLDFSLPGTLNIDLLGYFEPYAQAYWGRDLDESVYVGCTVQSISQIENEQTGVGEDVEVTPLATDALGNSTNDSPVIFTFENVMVAGTTTVEVYDSGPEVPSGYLHGASATYLNLETSAIFSDSVDICIDYSSFGFAEDDQLHLLHYNNASWDDITTVNDSEEQTLCGLTDSFSPFTVVKAAPKQPSLELDVHVRNAGGNGLTFGAGDELAYSVVAKNTGDVPLTNLVVTSDLLRPSARKCASIAPDAICALSGVVPVTQADLVRGHITHIATATSQLLERQVEEHRVGIDSNPELSVRHIFTSPETEIYAGDQISYSLEAVNNGDVMLTRVEIIDRNLSPNQEICRDVRVGGKCILTGTYTVTEQDANNGRLNNLGLVSSSQTNRQSIRLTAPVTSAVGIIEVITEVDTEESTVESSEESTFIADTTDVECVDTDGDGWGWNGTASCSVTAAISDAIRLQDPHQTSNVCVDTDGDGYGWDGQNTCLTSVSTLEAEQAQCVDFDGDGYGWNGTTSCLISMPVDAPVCIDIDGDGWGWDGSNSCRITASHPALFKRFDNQ
jgi:uncharacterized repeat protein (TIGR01451 family)